MNGIADYAVAVILVALLGWITWKMIMRAAELVIDGIGYVTREERQPPKYKAGILSGVLSVNESRYLQGKVDALTAKGERK